MTKYAQIIIGPAGSGKSTYCNTIQKHCVTLRRNVHVVNLDPAAEHFDYALLADIRDLISIDDVMDDEDLKLGPNGGLIFCMEHLIENLQWLEDALGDMDGDYILFDCPGQIELFTHSQVMVQLIQKLQCLNFNICSVFLIDSQFLLDPSKFISGIITALATMVNLETSHINVLTKVDLLDKKSRKNLDQFLEPDAENLLESLALENSANIKYEKLNKAIAKIADDFSLVRFISLDITDDEMINDVLMIVDSTIQYGEENDPKEPMDEYFDREEQNIDD